MDTQQPLLRIPEFRFRVLVIGRANAGKTTILQRVCETTDSPIFYRIFRGKEKVKLYPSIDRGEHWIDDELEFSSHKGYVFHDSRGIESGGTGELEVLQEFIRRKCEERRLADKLHAIWYCVPMDNQRPQLDMKFFKDICPDRNVPVIVVFTKYDQFRRNVQIHVEDFGSPDDDVFDVADKQFEEHYLRPLGDDIRFVRLEKMHRQDMRCDELIETTAAALNDDIVASMFLAVQRDKLELSVKTALNRAGRYYGAETKYIVRGCLVPFPYIWFWGSDSTSGEESFGIESGSDLVVPEELRRRQKKHLEPLAMHAMSLPTVQNLIQNGVNGPHLILAVILIFKHATLLRLSGLSSESALTQADLECREANIDLKIQQHLMGSSQDSVRQSAGFITATEIESSQSSVTAHLHTKVPRKVPWFKRWHVLRTTTQKV